MDLIAYDNLLKRTGFPGNERLEKKWQLYTSTYKQNFHVAVLGIKLGTTGDRDEF